MNKEIVDNIGLTIVASIFVAGVIGLCVLFSGEPDIADGWICGRLEAKSFECARILRIRETTYSETTQTTTKPIQ